MFVCETCFSPQYILIKNHFKSNINIDLFCKNNHKSNIELDKNFNFNFNFDNICLYHKDIIFFIVKNVNKIYVNIAFILIIYMKNMR